MSAHVTVDRGVLYDSSAMEALYSYTATDGRFASVRTLYAGMAGGPVFLAAEDVYMAGRLSALVRSRGEPGVDPAWREVPMMGSCEPLSPGDARRLLESRAADDPAALSALGRLGWAPVPATAPPPQAGCALDEPGGRHGQA